MVLPYIAGSQCLVNNASPTECNTGTYNLLGSSTACIECPGGKSCADKTVSPVACPTGELSFFLSSFFFLSFYARVL